MNIISDCIELIKRRLFLILWISLVTYLFYSTFIYYMNARQFYHLRRILGLGLCISRGTATILNLCASLVLLPLCKKLNQTLYHVLSRTCPALFFYWLERAKSFHMTVAITLVLFAVIHSISHFANLWNFSRGYDEERPEINFATHRNENPIVLLFSQAGLTGVSMLLITLSMGLTSIRVVRRKFYNAFWYTHQLYIMFLALLIVHPLSGVLKEEASDEYEFNSHVHVGKIMNDSTIIVKERFVSIKSKTWLWMAFPLFCFLLDHMWRIFSRNRARVNILNVTYMPGRVISLAMSCPHERFVCRRGQYVLLQCLDVSLLEWHPFTVVKVPISSQNNFVLWIRVKGDWTENLERLLLERGPEKLSVFVDGPFSSPIEGAGGGGVAVCVAAGVGITPFVSLLHHMLMYPRSHSPGRIHLLWIVRHEEEITWLAELASTTMAVLRDANRPDRLHIEMYVTNSKQMTIKNEEKEMLVVVNGRGVTENITKKYTEDEKASLLTHNTRRVVGGRFDNKAIEPGQYSIAKEYPVLACRVRKGKPHWDRVFGYWVHLYPNVLLLGLGCDDVYEGIPGRCDRLKLYCCGPKKLVKLLSTKCKYTSRTTKTKFTFVHEGFS